MAAVEGRADESAREERGPSVGMALNVRRHHQLLPLLCHIVSIRFSGRLSVPNVCVTQRNIPSIEEEKGAPESNE